MGMLNRDKYLASRKIGHKFIALDKANRLTMWNIITGKFISQTQLEGQDFRDYEIFAYRSDDVTYKREWYQPRTLLYCKKEVEDYQEEKDIYVHIFSELRESISYAKSQ